MSLQSDKHDFIISVNENKSFRSPHSPQSVKSIDSENDYLKKPKRPTAIPIFKDEISDVNE